MLPSQPCLPSFTLASITLASIPHAYPAALPNIHASPLCYSPDIERYGGKWTLLFLHLTDTL